MNAPAAKIKRPPHPNLRPTYLPQSERLSLFPRYLAPLLFPTTPVPMVMAKVMVGTLTGRPGQCLPPPIARHSLVITDRPGWSVDTVAGGDEVDRIWRCEMPRSF
ncbi:hypothetical protein DPEC_G00119400 [Dallia pectoralis]|uniref:Uncharacterized protein n=1 Tax=Dallia pectoralis TaxID=75939 RepID=A0ACC2GPE6_DALPE|nr:hypothetical protein DPEC_G00119400 [Dallia pectoralis]